MRKLLAIAVCLALTTSGCGMWPFNREKPDAELIRKRRESQQTDFNKGALLLEKEKFVEAKKSFESFLTKHPGSDLELMAVYNIGASAEGLAECEEAIKSYRNVIKTSAGKFPRMEAQALFRMSYAYECLKEDAKAIATLKDVEKRKNHLNDEISLAEWPARLAAAYARTGNRKLAEKYFHQAEDGLKVINGRTRDPERKKGLLAKTLFYMGNMERQQVDLGGESSFLQNLRYLQTYLLKSVELESAPWSARASDQILDIYGRIYGELQAPGGAKVDDKKELAQQALAGLVTLKQMRFPDNAEPKSVQRLFAQVDLKEKQMRDYLTQLEVRNNLTPEGKARTGIRQQGVIKGP